MDQREANIAYSNRREKEKAEAPLVCEKCGAAVDPDGEGGYIEEPDACCYWSGWWHLACYVKWEEDVEDVEDEELRKINSGWDPEAQYQDPEAQYQGS